MLKSREDALHALQELLLLADDKRWEKANTYTEDTRLMEDLGFSSIDMLYIVIAVEERFNMRFQNITMGSFRTLGDVIDYLEKEGTL